MSHQMDASCKSAAALMLSVVLGVSALPMGCAAPSTAGLSVSGQAMVRTELFFGLSRPNGVDVTEAEFQKFLIEEVTPRFPSGYSVITVQGHWREQTGRDREEPSRVLIILHPNAGADNSKIEQIRNIYKTRFAQEAVLRTDEWEKVSF